MKLELWTCDRCKKESRSNQEIKERKLDIPTGHVSRLDVHTCMTVDLCEECALQFNQWWMREGPFEHKMDPQVKEWCRKQGILKEEPRESWHPEGVPNES